ncbi:double-strand break repair protein AddB [Qipengyuania sp.]|uniref:double-strand break repair protein AddB n=1 Tax=Qipengyuania sp. TaxID=2004515 RepID=UPI0035C8220F
MADPRGPRVYSIAAHRGFADALVAGLLPAYREEGFGLGRLTLLIPSNRVRRTITEAFIRLAGENGDAGLIMPRMAVVGDLDLDESLGAQLDPLGALEIPRAVRPLERWLTLAGLLREELADRAPKGAGLFRLAREFASTMDRLIAEEVVPDDLLGEPVRDLLGDLAVHWQASLATFARVQAKWRYRLDEWSLVDEATRRNLLFRHASRRWKAQPPETPIIAAGVTSAAPALCDLLRTVSELPSGAVVLPDLDLSMSDAVWDELGRAGGTATAEEEPFARGDAVTHPQYHLKLLLNRMGISRQEVMPWHRRGQSAAEPERSHAISALFLPPVASRSWVDLPADRRRLRGVRIMQCANPEEEAQAVAVLVREAMETAGKRVAVITPDRALARRIAQHLKRWEIDADDSAGRALSETPTGRLILLVAELAAGGISPVALMGLLMHPLVSAGMDRGEWLGHVRLLERGLRGPRPRQGLEPLSHKVAQLEKSNPGMGAWWSVVATILSPLEAMGEREGFAEVLGVMVAVASDLAGSALWARADGQALSSFVEDLSLASGAVATQVEVDQIDLILRDAMAEIAVRPPWGGHPRVSIYGLLEARMSRADLIICAGMNEGVWPAPGSIDSLLAPPVLRALGVPGADFRIGLSAHDLAGAMGAPEVVLSRAARDESGPAIPSRFLLRTQALLGNLLPRHEETRAVRIAREMTQAKAAPPYPRPAPMPSPQQREVDISATALDRLLGDPFQFYAQRIMGLSQLDGLEAEPGPAWQGTTAHEVLRRWHKASEPRPPIEVFMHAVLDEENAHPLVRALWEPRLLAALQWVESSMRQSDRAVLAVEDEAQGRMIFEGVRVHGRADRIDRLPDGGLAIVDYKTGTPPSASQVEAGFALQLGVLGLIAANGGFAKAPGLPEAYEYWSLGKSESSETGFGYVETPLKVGNKRSGLLPEELLPRTEEKLREAVGRYIKGDEPFRARQNPDYPTYDTYDQLMRLVEWMPHLDDGDDAP